MVYLAVVVGIAALWGTGPALLAAGARRVRLGLFLRPADLHGDRSNGPPTW
ncbi:MAG: hypothetical protein WDN04_06145 [Rhodospirillales bacterium]